MISPSIESSDFLFWHKKNFELDFWKFCGKQTKYISRVQIYCAFTVPRLAAVDLRLRPEVKPQLFWQNPTK
jgi:hypothetical protein